MLNCGPGLDRVRADRLDLVRGCERVDEPWKLTALAARHHGEAALAEQLPVAALRPRAEAGPDVPAVAGRGSDAGELQLQRSEPARPPGQDLVLGGTAGCCSSSPCRTGFQTSIGAPLNARAVSPAAAAASWSAPPCRVRRPVAGLVDQPDDVAVAPAVVEPLVREHVTDRAGETTSGWLCPSASARPVPRRPATRATSSATRLLPGMRLDRRAPRRRGVVVDRIVSPTPMLPATSPQLPLIGTPWPSARRRSSSCRRRRPTLSRCPGRPGSRGR